MHFVNGPSRVPTRARRTRRPLGPDLMKDSRSVDCKSDSFLLQTNGRCVVVVVVVLVFLYYSAGTVNVLPENESVWFSGQSIINIIFNVADASDSPIIPFLIRLHSLILTPEFTNVLWFFFLFFCFLFFCIGKKTNVCVYSLCFPPLMNFYPVAVKDHQRPHLQHTVRTAQVRYSTSM